MKKNIISLILLATLLFVVSANSKQTFAQTNRASKQPKAQKFTGSPDADKTKFKKFIIRNINKIVYLKLDFEENDLYGYKSGNADPVFSVDNYSYFLECLEEQNALWTERCSAIKRSADNTQIEGYFRVKEPKPKTMRTNRMFTLTPVYYQ